MLMCCQVAVQEAERVGATVVFGDKDVKQTMQALTSNLSLADMVNLLRQASEQRSLVVGAVMTAAYVHGMWLLP